MDIHKIERAIRDENLEIETDLTIVTKKWNKTQKIQFDIFNHEEK